MRRGGESNPPAAGWPVLETGCVTRRDIPPQKTKGSRGVAPGASSKTDAPPLARRFQQDHSQPRRAGLSLDGGPALRFTRAVYHTRGKLWGTYRGFFAAHLAAAAFFAISRRLASDSRLARAGPPFKPPVLPNATACGFFPVSGSPTSSPVARLMIRAAKAFGSRGIFFDRFTGPVSHGPRRNASRRQRSNAITTSPRVSV